jgi:hypothetical protein
VRAQSYSVLMEHCPRPAAAKMESLHRSRKHKTESHCWKEHLQTFSHTISQWLGPFLRVQLLSNPGLEVKVNGLALLHAMLKVILRVLLESTAALYRLQTNQQLVQKPNAKLYIMFHLEDNVERDTANVNAPSARHSKSGRKDDHADF